MYSYTTFKEKLKHLRSEINSVCEHIGRNPAEVTILPVTKDQTSVAIQYASQAELHAVGENKVQEAEEKKKLSKIPMRWELIGHLQTNKAKQAVELFDRIQSVDSEKLLLKINQYAAELNKSPYPILLQVNAGKDPAKFGLEEENVRAVIELAIKKCPHIKLEGLMTIAPLTEDTSIIRTTFRNLKTLRDQLQQEFKITLPELSMGMSGDWKIAIEEGSTQVRIGSYLFGDRM